MLLLLCSLISTALAQTVGDTGWYSLTTTWSINKNKGFFQYPTFEEDAKAGGYEMVMKCGENGAPGNVYAPGGDISSMPFYRLGDGKIGGIILGMLDPGASSQKAPFISHTTLNGTTIWGVQAHFREPSTMCTAGTNDDIWVGDRLWFALDNDQSSYYKAPLNESASELTRDGWVYGACFFSMGYHWWRYITVDMNCNDVYPIFLLYNNHQLNAWGIAMAHDDRPDLSSPRWEHPHGSQLDHFFQPGQIPKCLPNQGTLSSQHVYLSDAQKDQCPSKEPKLDSK